MFSWTYVFDDELPFRVTVDTAHGAAANLADAAFRALSVSGKIPHKDSREKKLAANYLFWNYAPTRDWVALIRLLETGDLEEPTDERKE